MSPFESMTSFWLSINVRNANKVVGIAITERTRWFNVGIASKQLTIAVKFAVLEAQKKEDHASIVACISDESAQRTPSSISASRTQDSTWGT